MTGLTREYANLILNRVKDDPGSCSVEVVTRALVATGDLRVCPNTEDEPPALGCTHDLSKMHKASDRAQ
jgi:hypothetical protein